MIIFFNTSVPLPIEITAGQRFAFVGNLGGHREHVIERSILTSEHKSCGEPTKCQGNTAESLKQPNFLAFLRGRILLSVLQPFFSRRWVSMAPSRPPNLSLSPPATRPQLPRPCLPKNRPIFAPLLFDDLQLEETKPKDSN